MGQESRILPREGRKWYQWYSSEDTPEERRLILKLDLLIVPYLFILYWIKYLDQSNINNAYASGMSDDLNFHGNELVQFQTVFYVGNVVGLLPFVYLFPRVPMHVLVPTMDLGWGVFTLLQYRAQSYGEIVAYRVMVSLFEASYFPGVHFVLGAWYRSDEVGRRGGAFYAGLTLGTLTASLLQAAATKYLDSHAGLAGWRWAFIINAVITLPLAFLGYFILPGTPAKPNRLVLKPHEVELAKYRLARQADGTQQVHQSVPFSWGLLKRILGHWRFWVLVGWDTIFFNTSANSAAFLLWIKSLDRYDTPTMNNLAALSPALGLVFVLGVNAAADLWVSRPVAITLASAVNFTALVLLAAWDEVPEAAKWFAFSVTYSAVAVSSVLYGWANAILSDNAEERGLTLTVMTLVGTATNAFVPNLVYPTVEAPRYPKGYVFSTVMVVCLVVSSWGVFFLFGNDGEKRRSSSRHNKPRRQEEAEESEVAQHSESEKEGGAGGKGAGGKGAGFEDKTIVLGRATSIGD